MLRKLFFFESLPAFKGLFNLAKRHLGNVGAIRRPRLSGFGKEEAATSCLRGFYSIR